MVEGCSFYSCLIVQLHTSRSQAPHKVRLSVLTFINVWFETNKFFQRMQSMIISKL